MNVGADILTAASDPDLTGLALSAAVSAAVGLAVGLVAFPFRWWLQSRARRRQENVSAYRDALRVLRGAQREALYGKRARDARRERDAIPALAWDEALHRMAEACDAKTYEQFEYLAGLSLRAGALASIFPPEAGEDPRGELLEYAVELLLHRMRHSIRGAPDHATRLAEVEERARAADAELTRQWNENLRIWQESQQD